MAGLDPANVHHQAALRRLETVEALAAQARINLALADAAEREGVDGDPLRDAARAIAELGRIEARRCIAIVDEVDT